MNLRGGLMVCAGLGEWIEVGWACCEGEVEGAFRYMGLKQRGTCIGCTRGHEGNNSLPNQCHNSRASFLLT